MDRVRPFMRSGWHQQVFIMHGSNFQMHKHPPWPDPNGLRSHWQSGYISTNASSKVLLNRWIQTRSELLWSLHMVYNSKIYGNVPLLCDDFSRCSQVSSKIRSKGSRASKEDCSWVSLMLMFYILLCWYSHYTGHAYSHPHLSAITDVSHFTCNMHLPTHTHTHTSWFSILVGSLHWFPWIFQSFHFYRLNLMLYPKPNHQSTHQTLNLA